MESGMYVFDRGVALYYVDPDNGSDANSGNSPSSPMQTIPAAVAKTKIGDWVLIKRGTRTFSHLDIQAAYRHFGAYGQGVKPILDGSTTISGPWVQHGTYTNVWYADVTLKFATTGDYAFNRAAAWHPTIWDEGETDINETAVVSRRLRGDPGVSASADQSDILGIVNSEPGTFCVFKQGSSDPEPRNGNQTGTDWRVYLHTRDNTNPNENGRVVRIGEVESVLRAGMGQRWHDITFQRSCGGNLVSSATNTVKTEIFKNCDFLEAGFHACVTGGVTFEDCVAKATRSHSDGTSYGSGGFHQHRDEVSGTGTGFQVRNCYASGFGYAVYTHGGPAIQHEYYDVEGFTAERCNVVFGGSSRRGIVARNIKAKDCSNLSDATIIIDDSELYLSYSIRRIYSETTTRTLLRNCLVVGSEYLLFLNLDFPDVNARPTLELENCTVYTSRGYTDGESSIRRKFNLSLKNSIVAGYPLVTGTVARDSESTLEVAGNTVLDQSQQGHTHTIEFEVTEDDVVWINAVNNRTVSYSGTDNGDGTASLSVSLNNRTFGTWIKVPDGNGPGEDYQGRIISNGESASDPLIVSPPPQAAFSGVVFQVPVFKHYLHRDEITGTLSEDGSQIRVPDGRFFYPGNAIRVGSVGTKTFGLRYIASVDGNTITLDKPCPWKIRGDNIAYNSLDGITTTNRRPLPTVEIGFGFPIRKRRNDFDLPRITVTSPGGDVIWQRQQNVNTTSEFPNWSATEEPRLGTRYLPDGTLRPNGQYNGGIQHELGYWDLGLAGMGIGDTIKFEFKIEIEEELVRFDADPAYLRRYLPNKDSRPFQRQAGYRG